MYFDAVNQYISQQQQLENHSCRSDSAFSSKNEMMMRADLYVDDHVDVDHAVCQLKMQQDMQTASVIILNQ